MSDFNTKTYGKVPQIINLVNLFKNIIIILKNSLRILGLHPCYGSKTLVF